MHLILTLLLLAAPPQRAAPAPDSLLVDVAGRIVVLRSTDFAALPHDTVRASFHGGPMLTCSGVPLVSLLRLAGVPIDSLHGPQPIRRLPVEAADGDRALFSLVELAPGLGDRVVIVADRLDGTRCPPPRARGACSCPATAHGRWVRRVTALRILDEGPSPGR